MIELSQLTDVAISAHLRDVKSEISRRKSGGLWPRGRDLQTAVNRSKSIQHNNTSGHKGVTFNKNADRWQAKIGTGQGKYKHLGYFKTVENAIAARKSAESEIWHD